MTHRLQLIVLVITLTHCAGAIGHAQEWTRFRGPNGSGVSDATTVPIEWAADDYRWKVELPGTGHGSPVVWGDRLFVMAEGDNGRQRIVQCRRTGDGELVWSKPFDADKHRTHQFNSFASSTPAIDEQHVYIAWGTPQRLTLMALTHDGDVAWEAEGLGGVKGGHGFGCSPIVYGELVILGNDQNGDSSLIAVNRMSGKVVWNVPRRSQRLTYSTPVVYDHDGADELIFVNWQHGITALDPQTGETKWEKSVFDTSSNERAIGSPVLFDDLIIATCAFANSPKHLVAVRPGAAGNAEDADVVWRVDNSTVPHIPTMLVYKKRLYAWSDQGICTCYVAGTGKKVWQSRIGGRFFGSPVCVDGKLYAIDADGVCVVIRAGDEFEELARNDLGESSHATPAVANGMMFLRTFSHLMAVGGDEG